MKKLIYLVVFAFVATSVFTSCEDDDEANKIVKVKIGAQANTTIGGFYSTSKDKVYTMTEAYADQASIDIFCFYEEGNDIALAGPGSKITGIFTGDASVEDWETKNETRFCELPSFSELAFDALAETDATIETLYIADDGRRKAKALAVGDIYAVKTGGDKYGILKITAVSSPAADGWVEFEIKMKK